MIPSRFMVRVAYPCPFVAEMPRGKGDHLFELPESARLDPLSDDRAFADVRLAWNESGIGIQAEVRGKSQRPIGDPARPSASDGLTLWLDTRGDRSSHRASRFCHQFHFLAAAGGKDRDEPWFSQVKIHRALADAPMATAADVPMRVHRIKGGYRLEAFLVAAVLNGFDPEQNPRLGVCYAVRDFEMGEQILGLTSEFPYAEDPSLWSVLELVQPETE